MFNWICGVPPARPPRPSVVKAGVIEHNASVVSITGIKPLHGSENEGAFSSASTLDSSVRSSFSTTESIKPPQYRGVGVLIHPALILTTHSTIPSPLCISDAEITFCRDVTSLTYVKCKFAPEIFFETNVELDLTIVSCEVVAPDLSYCLPLDTTRLCRRAIRKGHHVFIMGCQMERPDDIVIMEGCINNVVRSDSPEDCVFLRFQTASNEIWMPGTAGFDAFGRFSFIITKPPGKPQQKMQSAFFKLGNESSNSRLISPEKPQASQITGKLFEHRTKQWATCLQAIKAWIEPLWKSRRNGIFEDTTLQLKLEKQMSRPSTQGDALFKQKSFTPRNSVTGLPQEHESPSCNERDHVEEATSADQPPTISDRESKKESSLCMCIRERLHDTAKVPPAVDDKKPSDLDMQKAHLPNSSTVHKHQLSNNPVFIALRKPNTGLKKLSQRSRKPKKPVMESVAIQTDGLSHTEEESTKDVEDAKEQLSLVRRASQLPSVEVSDRIEDLKTNTEREKWSLPGELDPIVMKVHHNRFSCTASTTLKGANAPITNAKRGMQSQRQGSSTWIDNYYALGRSRSDYNRFDHSFRSPRPSLSSASVVKSHIENQLGLDDVGFSLHKGLNQNPLFSEDALSANTHRSLSSSYSTLYNKPTLSYMQRRSLVQQDQLARHASQLYNGPRWS
ncbi:hypothetical protein KP509_31G022900 [Ceratopteris richardii]|uniref:Uncharacterized protein n=1 Tax=Ceratopteris richardii TaxID=49495 RepID=A0A8T2QYD4_CERRI|nr:hypothetical protein KP509_31G022900 [Ceratopteris richardii]